MNVADLRKSLADLMLVDQRRLRRRVDGATKIRDDGRRAAVLDRIAGDVASARERVSRRRAAVPKITYPAELPVSQRKDDLLRAIRDHQVVIVAGETGSGKTTQLPKICLELGRGITGLIGHTQPRRLAARTVAQRIAEELGTELGETVGFKVRFTDQGGDDTLVKLMTDGILLAELSNDRSLSRYDTLIIDEAHERSLNIDFILGYLKRLLPKRPDLKVIITSATIDPQRFSTHFSDAPIIEVSGRTYPVEVRYRPVVDPDSPESEERDQIQAICDAVRELERSGPGDVLVFLSGEREIRDTAEALNRLDLRDTEVVPLYARLSWAEQQRVFQSHRGRRVVLATNVAETSLTVPGIKYVIDPGTARISRYSMRTKVQRLPIEPVSQASANQRKGRCGRTSDGICIRLYSEAEFLARPEFTDPEILRTNLASVILQMASLGLGEVADFPFIDPPDRRNINAGVQLLEELGALDPRATDPGERLTPLGRQLARLPVDPRLGRMVLAADKLGCLREVMIIAAGLTIADPRERPAESRQAADAKHARFADPDSDFMAYLNLWNHLAERQRELSSNQFRRMCRADHLNFLRIREWQDINSQLKQVIRDLDMTLNDVPADSGRIHQALLAGLLSHIGLKDVERKEYLGARNARFAVFPGSGLFKKQPRWVMAAELVETSRLWAREVARIDPEWIEPLAGHLVKRTYSEPHWERKQGSSIALERVTLYGVPIVVGRKVQFGRIDPETARALFIRHALVEGDWETRHRFFHRNRELLAEIEDLENRVRRRDLVVDEQTLYEFYDKRVAPEVVSARHFDTWWRTAGKADPNLLDFDRSMLLNEGVGDIGEFPDVWSTGGAPVPLSYRFEPGQLSDGVTAHVPLQVLNQVSADGFAWQVPGLREEIVTSLIKSLPKNLRRSFVPVTDYARSLVPLLSIGDQPLLDVLEQRIRERSGVTIRRSDWDLARIPEHLRMTFRVIDERNQTLAEGADIEELKDRLKPKMRATLSAAARNIEKTGIREWDFGDLPRKVERDRGGFTVTAYPALIDNTDSVAIRMLETEVEQASAMWTGTRRLLLLKTPTPSKHLVKGLDNQAKLTLGRNPHGGVAPLLADCVSCAADQLITAAGGPVWTEAAFNTLAETVRRELVPTAYEILRRVESILALWHRVQARLSALPSHTPKAITSDVNTQLDGLVHPDFATAVGAEQLRELPRYLQAIEKRLDKVTENPARDLQWLAQISEVTEEYRQLTEELPASPELTRIRWMIEELRVSLFAQPLRTAYPISTKRIHKAIDTLAPA